MLYALRQLLEWLLTDVLGTGFFNECRFREALHRSINSVITVLGQISFEYKVWLAKSQSGENGLR